MSVGKSLLVLVKLELVASLALECKLNGFYVIALLSEPVRIWHTEGDWALKRVVNDFFKTTVEFKVVNWKKVSKTLKDEVHLSNCNSVITNDHKQMHIQKSSVYVSFEPEATEIALNYAQTTVGSLWCLRLVKGATSSLYVKYLDKLFEFIWWIFFASNVES